MLYFVGWTGCLVLCGISTLYLFPEKKSWIEQVVVSNNFGIILYLFFSIIFIVFQRFAVWKILLCIVLFNIVLLAVTFGKKYKKGKRQIQRPASMEWVMIGILVFALLLVRVTVEDIGTVSDQGSYFLHTLELMEGNTSIAHTVQEYGTISDEVDNGLEELQNGLAIFYHEEDQHIYYIHALSTWCSIPALFGKMFGIWKCMRACNYLYILSVVNMFYLCRKINGTRYGGSISLFLFALSPLILYIAKAGLTEVAMVYLFILGFKLILDKRFYLAGICIGMVGYIHISMYIYMPIITTLAFLESLRETNRKMAVFNVIQMILFYTSVWYANIVSPIYTKRELGRLTVGKLPYNTLLIIITAVIVVCVAIQIYVYIRPKKSFESIYLKVYDNFRVISLSALGICICFSVYYAYGLCYTDKYSVPYDPSNTWSMRGEYINTGISAVSYLNIVNIGRATGIVGIAAIIYCLVKNVKMNGLLKALYYLELYGLFVYTVIRIDVPFNYYASRYFIPFVIPLITVILEALTINSNWKIYIIMVSILYNHYFWPSFVQGAPFVGQYDILKDALENIPYESMVLCSPESTYVNTRLTNNLRLLNRNRVYNLKNVDEIIPIESNVYMISDIELGQYNLVFSKIYDVQWSFGHGENGRYSMEVGTHEIPIYIYRIN